MSNAADTNKNVVMGDVVIVRGAEYTVVDEPTYVRRGDAQMIRWVIRPVPAGLKTGTHCGIWDVWPNDRAPRPFTG